MYGLHLASRSKRMTAHSPYRRHLPEFKLELCKEIRAGLISRREAQRKHRLSANLIQRWLTLYDRGALAEKETPERSIAHLEKRVAALEGRTEELTMKIDKLRGIA
jgi:transposase